MAFSTLAHLHTELHEAIGKRLTALRLDSGRTKTYISNLTGYSRGYITKLENGKSSPTVYTLAVFAVAYGVPVEFFITGRGLTRKLTDPMKQFLAGHAPVKTKIPVPRSRAAQAH